MMSAITSIDPLTLVTSECMIISSEMRKVPKWSQNGVAAILGGQLYSGRDLLFGSDMDETNRFGIKNFNNAYSRGNGEHGISSRAKSESPLVGGFTQLRILLTDMRRIEDVDTLTLLQPFLMVIKSSATSGYITALALSSLSKFIQYSIISPTSKNVSQSLPQIISSLTRCRFEAGDQASDDAVLLKVLRLLENILNSSLGDILSDDVVYEVIQTCLSLACNKRRSEVLRRAAEMAMVSITIRIFAKLKDIKPEVSPDDSLLRSDHHILQEDIIGGTDGAEAKPSFEQTDRLADDELEGNTEANSLGTDESDEEKTEKLNEEIKAGDSEETAPVADSKPAPPYGIPCIKEYLSILIYMISPSNQYQHMESTRVFAFSLMNTAIEVSAKYLPLHPTVMALISDSTCKNLLQTLQSIDQPSLLHAALRLFITLTISFSEELNLQIELILLTIFKSISPNFDKVNEELTRIAEKYLKFEESQHLDEKQASGFESVPISRTSTSTSGRSTTAKEMMIENISILWARSPEFFVRLFIKYDCDFDKEDTAVNVIKYLCRLSLPDSAIDSTDNVPPIALEGLLSFIGNINDRVKHAIDSSSVFTADEGNILILQKTQKQAFLECVKLFNEDDKKGLALLNKKGFIRDINDLDELAKFYFEKSAGLNKKSLGEILAKPSNLELLKKFMSLFNFANLRVDEALRVLLKSFRLPGESQQIERIVETFAEKYVNCQNYTDDHDENVVQPDKDAVFVLSYSIIMLNTDAHSPKVKHHMTLEEYQRNLRGVYAGKDFPSWYLEKIYSSIQDREIIIPEEHHGTTKWFDDMWNNLIAVQETSQLTKQNQALDSKLDKYQADYIQFDRVIFEKTSDYVISTLLTIFEEASDDHIITRMMTTIDRYASIASFFKLYEVLDKLIEVLSHLTTLTGVKASQLIVEDGTIRDVIPVTQIKVEESKEIITVSEVSVWFGRDFKAQLSTIELFRILKKHEFLITNHWINIVTIILTLFENCLITPDIFPEFQKKLNLPPIPKVRPQFQINRTKALKESGFLSSFSAFLKGYSDEPPEPTDEEIQSTISSINCIKSSNLLSLFSSISNTSTENSDKFVKLLLQLLPTKSKSTARFYDSEVCFILEIAVCLSLVSMNSDAISLIITIIDEFFETNKHQESALSEGETPEPAVGRKQPKETSPLGDHTKASSQIQQPNLQQQAKSSATIRVSTLVRLSTYKMLLLRNLELPSEKALIQTLDRLQTVDKATLLKHGTPLIKPLASLIEKGTWTKDVVGNKEQYWTLIRTFASSLKHNAEIFEFIQSKVEDCITESNYFLILGLLDEISSAGAVGAQWEQEYEKLISTGHKIEDKNPYEQVIQTSIKSIKLTGSIQKVIDYKILIQALCHQCYNPCNEIRTFAIATLSNVLLSSVDSGEISANSLSENCLFALLADIMKPENVLDINILKMITKYYLKVGLNNIEPAYLLKYVKVIQLMIRKAESKDFEAQALEMMKNMYLIFKQDNKDDENSKLVLKQLSSLIELPEEPEENATSATE